MVLFLWFVVGKKECGRVDAAQSVVSMVETIHQQVQVPPPLAHLRPGPGRMEARRMCPSVAVVGREIGVCGGADAEEVQ